MSKTKRRKPRPRYSRSMLVDYFDGIHGNAKPCAEGACPIVTAMGGRIDVADATELDPFMAGAFDRESRFKTGSSLNWHELTASEIAATARRVMAEEAV